MAATAALAIAPGPDNIYVLMQGITHGKKQGLATVAGLMSGCLVHTTLLAFGFSLLIKENEQLFFALKLFGAGYLFYLAYGVFKSDGHLQLSNEVPKRRPLELFRQGFIMNVVNPKVALFFLAFFPGFLFSDSLGTVPQFYILGLLFIAVSFLVFGLIVVLASSISAYLKKSKNAGIYLKWFQVLVFLGIGIFVLLS